MQQFGFSFCKMTEKHTSFALYTASPRRLHAIIYVIDNM